MDDKNNGGVLGRQESAKLHDDSGLIAEQQAEAGTSGAHVAGGKLATDVGTRDEERQLTGDAGISRVTKQDKVQPPTGTRSDNEGAQSGTEPGIGNTSL